MNERAERADAIPLGVSGLATSRVGLGAGALGELDEQAAHRLLDAAFDAGVRLIDTARSYGASETWLGQWGKRRDVTLCTKGGYGVEGVADWTYEAVRRGIAEARTRLGVDAVDVFHLHSCSREILERGEALLALHDAYRAGAVRAPGYSGDDEGLEHAQAYGGVSVVAMTLSALDQRCLDRGLAWSRERGLGVVVKRSLANAPWTLPDDASRPDHREQRRRWRALDVAGLIAEAGLSPDEAFVRFAAHQPGVSCVLVGTRHIDRLVRAIAAVAKGPLPSELDRSLRTRFATIGAGWPSLT